MSEAKTETTAKKKNGAKKKRTFIPLSTKQQVIADYVQQGLDAPSVAEKHGLTDAGAVYRIKAQYDAGSFKLPPRRPSAPPKPTPRGMNGAVTIARGHDGDLRHVTLAPSSGVVDVKLYDELRAENKALRIALKLALRGEL